MFNDTKAVLYKEKVILYNYVNIIDVQDNVIRIDKWIITGSELKIKELDSYYIIIKGIIEGVNFEKTL